MWGIAERIIPEGSVLGFLILPPAIAYGLAGMGIGFLLLYSVGRAVQWKGDARSWSDALQPTFIWIVKGIAKWGVLLLLAAFILLLIWASNIENPQWAWVHPSLPASEINRVENECLMRAYEAIPPSGNPFALGSTDADRKSYAQACMESQGFTWQKVEP